MSCQHQANTLAKIIHKFKGQNKYYNQAGFTIIEPLVAIIVVAILMTAIAPVILLSTANRVQARRIELATQAAKTYIDGVKAGSIDAPAESDKDNIAETSVPTASSISCDSGKYCSNDRRLFCVDGDNDNKCLATDPRDFIIQTFRTRGEANKGFGLGLRVYRADGFSDSGALKRGERQRTTGSAGRGEKSLVQVGLGDRKTPLVEMTTDVATDTTNFSDFCRRIQNNSNSRSACNNN